MASALRNILRLTRAGLTLGGYGADLIPKGVPLPWPVRAGAVAMKVATAPIRALTWPFRRKVAKDARIATALTRLGPSYIKLGQFLATRGDLLPAPIVKDLRHLQDRLPPFSMAEAQRAIEDTFGGKVSDHFIKIGPPIAAASIAQVHKAEVVDRASPTPRSVAVKVLRPGVERRFQRDLDSYAFAARTIEKVLPKTRRLRPTAVIDDLARVTELELDLRLEAAAISEMADNIKGDKGFRVPSIDWRRTGRRVMTIEWIDGTPIGDHTRLKTEGHDLNALGLTVLQSFLRHAMRDGFFHGDMHQGNLLVEKDGTIVAVDFGIVGRLGLLERRFLAEILYGLVTRNYRRAAEMHFEAGYVPKHHSVEVFAQAMRAIGEPIHGRTADEISMADLLGQLFAYTDVFDMETRPELILLQKSMVIVEGVARGLDPKLNMWSAAEPIAKEWLDANLGVVGRLKEAGAGAEVMGRVLADAPRALASAEVAARQLVDTLSTGVKIDPASLAEIQGAGGSRGSAVLSILRTLALVVGATSLAIIAYAILSGFSFGL
jgi:ubiquinone biosynthesis protein